MSDIIVNKVAESGLITLDPADYFPKEEVVSFDLQDYLFMGLILKEKDFRQSLIEHDWNRYKGKNVAVFCSADAIIPNWAYMLVVSYLESVAEFIYAGNPEETFKARYIQNIDQIKPEEYADKRIVIKGCGDKTVEGYVYLEITKHLKPFVKSVMYGEPCSTVPVYKRK